MDLTLIYLKSEKTVLPLALRKKYTPQPPFSLLFLPHSSPTPHPPSPTATCPRLSSSFSPLHCYHPSTPTSSPTLNLYLYLCNFAGCGYAPSLLLRRLFSVQLLLLQFHLRPPPTSTVPNPPLFLFSLHLLSFSLDLSLLSHNTQKKTLLPNPSPTSFKRIPTPTLSP